MIESKYKTLEEFLHNFYSANPFTTDLGIELDKLEENGVTIKLKLAERHTNVYGIAHGGVVLTMADMAMGASCLYKGAKVVTLNLTNNFIKAIHLNDVAYARGTVTHLGKSTVVAEARIFNQDGVLCATSTGTFFRIGNIEL